MLTHIGTLDHRAAAAFMRGSVSNSRLIVRTATAPAAAPQSRHFLGNVQALRAVAALLVVLVHASLPDVGVESVMAPADHAWLTPFQYIGLFGVDLFFVISGFIMLVTNWNNFGRRLAGARFFIRRAIRIYPPYWLALLPILPVLLFAKDRFMGAHRGVQTGIVESILLLPNQHKFVLTVGWTLVWEMIFYVVFAMLLRLDRRYVVAALAIWLSVQVLLYAAFNGSANYYLNFIATPLPIEFIFGTAVGVVYVKRSFPAPRTAACVAAAVAAGTWIAVTMGKISLENPNDINRVLVFGLPAMLLVYAAVALEVRGVFVAPRALRSIGDGSYAIYLWHLSLLVVLRQVLIRLHPAGPLAHGAILLFTIGIIIAFGMAIYRYFEKPVTGYLNGKLPAFDPVRVVEPPFVGGIFAESVAE